jgi:hypothetical protein
VWKITTSPLPMVTPAAFSAASISFLLNARPAGSCFVFNSFAMSSSTPRVAIGGTPSVPNFFKPPGATKSFACVPL